MPSADLVAARQHPSASQRHNSAPIRCVTRKYWPIQTAPISTCHKFSSSSFFFSREFPAHFSFDQENPPERMSSAEGEQAKSGRRVTDLWSVSCDGSAAHRSPSRGARLALISRSSRILHGPLAIMYIIAGKTTTERDTGRREGAEERPGGGSRGSRGGPSDASL